jgi:hypothetical protein
MLLSTLKCNRLNVNVPTFFSVVRKSCVYVRLYVCMYVCFDCDLNALTLLYIAGTLTCKVHAYTH